MISETGIRCEDAWISNIPSCLRFTPCFHFLVDFSRESCFRSSSTSVFSIPFDHIYDFSSSFAVTINTRFDCLIDREAMPMNRNPHYRSKIPIFVKKNRRSTSASQNDRNPRAEEMHQSRRMRLEAAFIASYWRTINDAVHLQTDLIYRLFFRF